MKLFLSLMLLLSSCLSGLGGFGDQGDSLGGVETNWPGVRYEVIQLKWIPADRLLVVLRISATHLAPASGTLIGTKVSMSGNVTKEELLTGRYAPRPFSFSSSQMIEDQTGRKYTALSPLPSAETKYLPAEVLTTLLPGQAELITLQFPAPTASRATDAGRKQTVSFLFANAKGPVLKVAVPPSKAASDSLQ